MYGFWDLLEKRTILLTASTNFMLEDLLHELYSLSLGDFINLESLYNKDLNKNSEPIIDTIVIEEAKDLDIALRSTINKYS